MAGGIWEAIGAALQQGGRTFGALTFEEQERKAREAEAARRAEQDRVQNDFQRRQLEGSEKDRQFRRLQAAIEGANVGTEFSEDFYNQAKEHGLDPLLKFEQAGTDLPIGGGIAGLPTAIPLPKNRITRGANFQEQRTMEADRLAREERERQQIFRTHIGSKDHEGHDHDATTAEAIAAGVAPPPMSAEEWERRQGIEHKNRMAQIGAQQAGLNTRAGATNPAQRQWWLNYDRTYRGIKGAFSKQLSELAEAGDFDAVAELESKIDAIVKERVGPMPQAAGAAGDDGDQDVSSPDATQELIDAIDSDVQKVGGDFDKLKKAILAKQTKLRAEGVDVAKYLSAVQGRVPAAATEPRVPADLPELNRPSPEAGVQNFDINDVLGWLKSQQQPSRPLSTPSTRLRGLPSNNK